MDAATVGRYRRRAAAGRIPSTLVPNWNAEAFISWGETTTATGTRSVPSCGSLPVYGARVKGNYRRLVGALARGWFIPIGDGRNLRTLVYERDVARAVLLRRASSEGCRPRLTTCLTGGFHQVSEVLAAICEALGRRPPRASVPIAIARGVAGALEDGAGLIGCRCPIGRVTIDKYNRKHRRR